MFYGSSEHALDDKNRIIIPQRFRGDLGEKFYMTRGIDNCIFIYSVAGYTDLTNKISELPSLGRSSLDLTRFFAATELNCDPQSRVLIPNHLKVWAKISESGNVLLVGARDRIEVWDPETWEQLIQTQHTDANLDKAAKEAHLA